MYLYISQRDSDHIVPHTTGLGRRRRRLPLLALGLLVFGLAVCHWSSHQEALLRSGLTLHVEFGRWWLLEHRGDRHRHPEECAHLICDLFRICHKLGRRFRIGHSHGRCIRRRCWTMARLHHVNLIHRPIRATEGRAKIATRGSGEWEHVNGRSRRRRVRHLTARLEPERC